LEFVLQALMKAPSDGSVFYLIPKKFRMNEDFILIAVLISYEARSWILGRWIHRADEITPGLSNKMRDKLIAARDKGIVLNDYDALLELAAEKEKELESRGVYIPARVYVAGATYGVLSTSRHIVEETKTPLSLPHIPFEIASKISQFSSLYSPAVAHVNRCALDAAEKALEEARTDGAFKLS